MKMRSLKLLGLLLLFILFEGCSKNYGYKSSVQAIPEHLVQDFKEIDDELNTQDHNMNIDKEGKYDEDINMSVDDSKEALEEVINDSSLEQLEQIAPDSEFIEAEGIIEQIKAKIAGTVINTTEYSQKILDSLFYAEELNQDIINRITGKSYKRGADIPYSDLRYIRLLHTGFDGLTHIGEMIVNKAIAEDVVDIFKELHSIEYPIEKMILIDEYNADDLESMDDNNSSAFNYRFVEGTTRRSVHSDGLAIDINPLYNPYVRTRDGKMEVLPESASDHVERTQENIYYIRKDGPLYKAFVSRGFT